MSEEINKTELVSNLLGRVAENLTEWFALPIYLSWFIIIWFIMLLLYIGFYTIEKFLQYFRMLIFAFGSIILIAIVIIGSGI